MPFFLTTVKLLLPSLGTFDGGFSDINHYRSGLCSCWSRDFFPGSLNFPERIRSVSTLCTIRFPPVLQGNEDLVLYRQFAFGSLIFASA